MTPSPHHATASYTPALAHTGDAPSWAVALLARLEQQQRLLIEVRELLAAKRKAHLTVAEVAQSVGRSEYTVRRWITEGRITAIRVEGDGPKGRLLISREELDRLVHQGFGGAVAPVELAADRASGTHAHPHSDGLTHTESP